jgi:hypothetical protein
VLHTYHREESTKVQFCNQLQLPPPWQIGPTALLVTTKPTQEANKIPTAGYISTFHMIT